METFLNVRLSARLGAAFGFLVLALAVVAAVGLSGAGKVNDHAEQISERDVAGLQALVTVSEDFLAGGYLVVRHLYVEDGDLEAQDRTAKEIEGFFAEGDKTVEELGPRLESAEAKRSFAGFEQGLADFEQSARKALELSRQETVDGVATVEQAREAFEVIGLAVESMTERVAEIAGAVQQISAGSRRAEGGIGEVAAVAEQSSASAQQVSASTQETSASTQEIASSAAEPARTAEQLDQLVRRFKVTA
jgi:chemoreceptor-like protein with four helix bundle sensory module